MWHHEAGSVPQTAPCRWPFVASGDRIPVVYAPSVCVILQGSKRLPGAQGGRRRAVDVMACLLYSFGVGESQ
jgi:hypothetical protein